ncbi:MAG: Stringent starvation protein [Sphingomonadales bacterium]|nr:Stringent starvation protein [Sphingomonadales bacterium]
MDNFIKPSKKDVAKQLMLRGSIFVHVASKSKRDDLKLPSKYRNQDQTVLQFGLDMPIPIHNLEINVASISGTLSFGGTPFFCNVPWECVFAIVGDDAKGIVWNEDMPAGIQAALARLEDVEETGKPNNVVSLDAFRTKRNHEKLGIT